MAGRFKFLRAVSGKSYVQQIGVYYACMDYDGQPERVRDKIDRLCAEAAGEHAAALKAYLTTGASWQEITQRFYLSDRTLDRARQRFYELW